MNYFSIKFKIAIMAVLFVMSPFAVFAQTGSQTCSSNGYTITTINGVLTNKDGAIFNRDALKYYFGKNYNGEPLTVDYLHNESHLGGAGDILKSILQGLFDSETVKDYDLVEMLQDASERVTTQKLLLVAHSQGNFYANSFYDTVADKAGGVPAESFGVYSVATPSGRVAGGGKWLTSDTDKAIAGIVGRVLSRKIMEPNTHIELQSGDDFWGHDFSSIYLKYQGDKIISDIKSSLDQLKTNNIQDAQKPCLASPELSKAHQIQGNAFAFVDPIASKAFFVAFKLPIVIVQTAVSMGTKAVKAGAEKVVDVVQTIKETFSEVFKKDEFRLAQVIDLSQETQSSQSGETFQPLNSKQCSFDTQKSPSYSKVIISEVAWMGGVNSANDEWIELKNISSGAVDLTGWQLIDKGEQIKIVFGKGSLISANGFYLLERTDDAAVPEVKADVIYSGILSNSDEGIRLFDGDCNLIDEASASPDWPAGDNKSRKTMERNSSDLNWYTSVVIGGTPKKENSQPVIVKKQETAINPSEETEEEDEEIMLQQKEQTKQQEQIQQATSSLQQTASFKQCSFSTNQSPLRQKIIINEIAWMGTIDNYANEWIELKNISTGAVDLTNWQLIDKGEQIKVVFGQEDNRKIINKNISAGGFYLLERTDDNTLPTVTADFVYSGALSNSDEGLRLFDNNCNLIDEVLANPNWPAGDNTATAKKTMERKSDFSWYASNIVGGTPKKENSTPVVVYAGGGGGGSGTTNNQQQTSNNQQSVKILINEIQIYSTSNRYIELYNPNDSAVDLTNWYIQRKTQTGTSFDSFISKTNFENKIISAKGYLLISRLSLPGADIVLSDLTLSEANTIQIKNSNQEIVDKLGWGNVSDFEGSGSAPSPQENFSIQRKFQNNTFVDTDNNANDFEIQSCPSPKAQTCQQVNQTPRAFFVYTPQNPQAGDLVTLNATSSTDPDGTISLFQWDFGNGQATTTQATTTYSYSTAGNYTVRLTVFDNQNASSTATSTAISISASGANHLVISEIYPDKSGNNFDFIELYNPINSSISLGDYSLKILKEGATSTESLASFSASHTIAAKSFFLIGLDKYSQSTSTTADVSRSSYFLPTTQTATIILYNDSNSVDEFNYNPTNLAIGQSFERKSFSGGSCVSAQNENEFLGNGCDTDSDSDFEIRNTPKPQNSLSFPEPRSAPATPSNFSVQYSSSTMELIFNWQASQDYSGATSTLTYKITDISNTSSTLATINTTSTTAKISISEFGRSYNFSIIAIDKEGYESEKSEAAISVPQSSLIIAQQTDKSSLEIGTANGQFYQLLGSGLTAEPKEVTFHAKFLASGYWKQTYYINVTFWQSDKSDYSNLIKVSSNTCTRDNPDATYYDPNNIYGSDCPNLNFEFGIDKDYTVPIQESFIFDPAKYYKLTLFIYQSESYFYGSADENSYLYGKSTKDNGQGHEIDSSLIKDLYFIIPSKAPFEIPPQTSQLVPQIFSPSYSSSTLEIVFNWDKPRYFENTTSTLTYKIIDISNSSSTLPDIETIATSSRVSINEVGRNYKFSIQAFDETGVGSIIDEREIKIPHSLAEKFIIASQSTSTSSEQGRTNGDFYQTLGAGLSGKLGAVTFKVDFNPTPYYISVDIFQSDNSDYSNLERFYEVARCNFIQSYGEPYCSNQLIEPDTYIVPVSGNFVFDPLKYYKLYFLTYQSTSNFYGSADENSYTNGQTTKLDGGGWEIQTSTIRDMYFILTSRTPLR